VNGPIAQAVALTCHANAALRRGGVAFPASHSTAQFCERITFRSRSRWWWSGSRAAAFAVDPAAWFELLRAQGRGGVLLHARRGGSLPSWLPNRASAGVEGGAGWVLEAWGRRRSAMWTPCWAIGDRGAADRRIWSVEYHSVGSRRPTVPTTLATVDAARRGLLAALERILAFSVRHCGRAFGDSFEAAQLAMTTAAHRAVYHRDLAPAGALAPDAEALLAACQHAWVFGGMGSWNDIVVAEGARRDYERVSDGLFDALNGAIAAAANSTFVDQAEAR
jgi:hypothetical protein